MMTIMMMTIMMTTIMMITLMMMTIMMITLMMMVIMKRMNMMKMLKPIICPDPQLQRVVTTQPYTDCDLLIPFHNDDDDDYNEEEEDNDTCDNDDVIVKVMLHNLHSNTLECHFWYPWTHNFFRNIAFVGFFWHRMSLHTILSMVCTS